MNTFEYLPTVCPSCGGVLEWKGVDLACSNKDCGDALIKALASFLIKAGVEGVTETSLSNWGITNFGKLIRWTSDGSKSHANFVKELRTKIFSKTQEELFSCFTFDGAGSTNINKILDFYSTNYSINGESDLYSTTKVLYVVKTYEDFPEGIGQKVIDKIEFDWKRNLEYLRLFIADARWNPVVKAKPVVNTDSKIAGKSFCITGTLSKKRAEFEKMVTDNGGTLSSVSKKLNFLLAGAEAGSKLDKAQELGITILTEDEFMAML